MIRRSDTVLSLGLLEEFMRQFVNKFPTLVADNDRGASKPAENLHLLNFAYIMLDFIFNES